MLPRVAIVGTGIAGLSSAYFLHRRFDLVLFEQEARLGGHTHTVDVQEPGRQVAFDTGFMVFNRVTYPLLTRFFRELGVPTQPTSMSFSVQHLPSGLEFNGTSLNHLFAQRSNLFRPSFYRLLLTIDRFNAEAVAALDDPRWHSMTVAEYVQARGYGERFLELFLVPMSSAVWSTPPALMLEFPAVTLLRFFHNHGFLGLQTQHPWWTVTGGAREYVRRLRVLLGDDCFRLRAPVTRVRRLATGGAEVLTRDGRAERFDRVLLATHADQALALLSDPDPEERAVLGAFRYQANMATVHTDTAVMPKTRRAWASWNYRMEPGSDGRLQPQTVYWMNSLQGVSDRESYFVSINGEHSVDPAKVRRRISYEHPLFNQEARAAQALLPRLNARLPNQAVYFAGSYFRYGFHEDAFGAGLAAARAIAGERFYDHAAWPE